MADERSRSPRRDIVWVKVKDGNAVMIKLSQMEAPQNVFNLLEAVKQVEKRKLDAVDVGDLQLFQNERAHANCETPIRSGLPMSEVNGGDSDNSPLYIFFPDSLGKASEVWCEFGRTKFLIHPCS